MDNQRTPMDYDELRRRHEAYRQRQERMNPPARRTPPVSRPAPQPAEEPVEPEQPVVPLVEPEAPEEMEPENTGIPGLLPIWSRVRRAHKESPLLIKNK